VFDRFTDEGTESLHFARRYAQQIGASEMSDLHALIGCCRTPGSLALRVLESCGQDPADIAENADLLARSSASGKPVEGPLPFSTVARKAIEGMLREAHDLGHDAIGSHHLLLGLIRCEGPAAGILARSGLDLMAARTASMTAQVGALPACEDDPEEDEPSTTKGAQVKTLLAAKDVCVDLRQYEVASKLRDLAHWLEHS
jgi:ATP-dependent Clp protease ATP-binding subunit ClpA